MDEMDNALNELSSAQIDELGYELQLWNAGYYKSREELKANVHKLIVSFQLENRSH